MSETYDILLSRLATKEAQVAALSDRLQKIDVSKVVRHSIFNCVRSPDLLAELGDYDGDGLSAIIDKLVAVGYKKLINDEVSSALDIFKFLFKYSFSPAPNKAENLDFERAKEFINMQHKLKRLEEIKADSIDVDQC